MRFVNLVTLLLIAAGGSYLLYKDFSEARAEAAAAQLKRSPPVKPRPADTAVRRYLAPEVQVQATKEDGFELPPQSLLRVAKTMQYGDFIWDSAGVPEGSVSVRVDLRTQVMSVFRAGHEIGTAVFLYGADSHKTPLGRHPILWKGKDHRSSIYDAPMPYTLRLTGDGVAIHGSDVRWGAATHGCVGIPKEFAAKLFEEAKVGDPVLIVRTGRSGPSSPVS